jgi:hypothetical protein
MTPAGLDQLAANHVTGSHWRLGPYGVDPTHPELLPYALAGAAPRPKEPPAAEPLILIALRGERLRGHPLTGPRAPVTQKTDLTRWNPTFWNLVRSDAAYANQHGVIPEIDLVDGWMLKAPDRPDVPPSPWRSDANIQGFDGASCAVTQVTPSAVHEAWIRKIVDTVGDLSVTFQDGNELFFCHPTVAWVTGLQAILHDQESRRGFPRHLFATQSQDPQIEVLVDYAQHHIEHALPPLAYPLGVNEYSPLVPSEVLRQIQLARAGGTLFDYWRGEGNDPQGNPIGSDANWASTLAAIKQIVDSPPPSPPTCTFPCPTGAECTQCDANPSPRLAGDVDLAVRAVQAANPDRFVGQHLVNGNAPDPLGNQTRQWFYGAVVTQLARAGLCGVTREDAVEVTRDSVNIEEYHLIAFNTGDIAGNLGFKTRCHRGN